MKCPSCSHADTSVIDSRVTREGREIRRRRACDKCGARFTTYERPEERVVFVVKKDKRREPYDPEKLRAGLFKACQKLDITAEQIEQAVHRVTRKVFDLNMEEVKSSTVGKFVMEELYGLDEVAYIRFASVYLRFQDISEFTRHVEELRRKKNSEAAQRAKLKPIKPGPSDE
ncbi:MAG: transcriptional repressor NrdR [Myxococcales bacterium]|nr:MAG: transcriptional repressor NrdR [Myxococcales bacterium]